jgi:hypothetical protein
MGLPGPWGVPFFYNFFDILQHKARIYDWFTENTLKVPPSPSPRLTAHAHAAAHP